MNYRNGGKVSVGDSVGADGLEGSWMVMSIDGYSVMIYDGKSTRRRHFMDLYPL